ncbi:NAD-dependent deacylase [Gordonia sp. HY442]|uniref:SIR2 family NAD-dependent protein deacylase n=1 Tax=Gordonia zhenghanii TaxID=2911516 RepID=UPI001F3754F0|nr:NAD-dependent deacylase [Gordonia zhenghanii]MCF8604110.1 NAD-dependent deacylase [Gordonia zhenghanii]
MSTAGLDGARDLLDAASSIVVFTGAGMSAESGIPTFRDALTGMWEKHDPMTLASPDGWAADPDLVWAWYADRATRVRSVMPNAGHLAVAELGRRPGVTVSVVTQNVDDLHERAGSAVTSHLHGSLFAPRCQDCGRAESPDLAVAMPRPACPLCGSPLRPGVVWFGEPLPSDDWLRAENAVSEADLMIVVGTTGVVYPAAELPERASAAGVPVVEVNPEPSAVTSFASVRLAGPAAQMLPDLLVQRR